MLLVAGCLLIGKGLLQKIKDPMSQFPAHQTVFFPEGPVSGNFDTRATTGPVVGEPYRYLPVHIYRKALYYGGAYINGSQQRTSKDIAILHGNDMASSSYLFAVWHVGQDLQNLHPCKREGWVITVLAPQGTGFAGAPLVPVLRWYISRTGADGQVRAISIYSERTGKCLELSETEGQTALSDRQMSQLIDFVTTEREGHSDPLALQNSEMLVNDNKLWLDVWTGIVLLPTSGDNIFDAAYRPYTRPNPTWPQIRR
jgi:hypothetical protein